MAAGRPIVRADRPAGNQCEFTLELGRLADIRYKLLILMARDRVEDVGISVY